MPCEPKPRYDARRREWIINYKRQRYYRSTEAEARALLRLLQAREHDSMIEIPARKDSQRARSSCVTFWVEIKQIVSYGARRNVGLLAEDPLKDEPNPYDKLTRERVLTDTEWQEIQTHLNEVSDGQSLRES